MLLSYKLVVLRDLVMELSFYFVPVGLSGLVPLELYFLMYVTASELLFC